MFKKVIVYLLSLFLLVSGASLIWLGIDQPPDPMPTVEEPITAPAGQEPSGPTENTVTVFPEAPSAPKKQDEVAKETNSPINVGTPKVMKPEMMEESRLFIPSVSIYSRVTNKNGAGSIQEGQLVLPYATEVTRWVDGSNVNSDKGNIVLAGHISWNGVRGSVYNLAYLKSGNRAYLTDSKGRLQEYQLESLSTIKKTKLPEWVWDTEADKKLVVVTCGGKITKRSDGYHFDSNTIAVFKPVSKVGQI